MYVAMYAQPKLAKYLNSEQLSATLNNDIGLSSYVCTTQLLVKYVPFIQQTQLYTNSTYICEVHM